MEKMASGGPKWDPRGFFPTNSDLADILRRTDLNFESFYEFHFLDPTFLDFQVCPAVVPQMLEGSKLVGNFNPDPFCN